MILVVTFGVWDLLHVGHVAFLERARSLGDRLIVGVPDDDVVFEDKGVLPVISLPGRVRMLQSLRCVDVAAPYHALEFLTTLEAIRPDVLAVGENWGGMKRHIDAEAWARRNGCRVVRLPRSPGESTSAIRERMRGT